MTHPVGRMTRNLGRALIVALALVGAYVGGARLLLEYRVYRVQQQQTYVMWNYFNEAVGTSLDPKSGKEVPLSRGDLLGEMGRQFVERSKAANKGSSQGKTEK